MNIKIPKPYYDKVLIEQVEAEKVTKGGIIIPEASQRKAMEGRIVAVGEGYRMDNGTMFPLQTKVNARVLFAPYGGSIVTYNGSSYVLVSERDILCELPELN